MSTLELRKRLGKYYSSKLSEIEDKIKEISPSYRSIFSSYTNHGTKHLENVEIYVNKIISDNIEPNLSEEEIFCLLCAIQFHDIGLLPVGDELVKFENKNKEDRAIFRDTIRENHHIRSENYILDHKELFNFSDLEAEAIGKIAKGHRIIDLKKYDDIFLEGKVRIRSLAAVLRLADECDITGSRDSHLSQEYIDNKTKREHFKKQDLFKQVRIDRNNIILSCYIYEEEDKKCIVYHKDKIKKELDKIKPYLNELNIMLNDVELEVHLDKNYVNNQVILAIAEDKDISSLESEWINSSYLEDSIDNLVSDNIIKYNKKLTIVENDSIFKKVFVNFSNADRNKFFSTKYARSMVERYFYNIENVFNMDVDYKYRNERIELLKMSPTAFYLLSNIEKILKEPDLNIRLNPNAISMVDSILAFGLFNDMFNYSEYMHFDEIIKFFDKIIYDKDTIFSKINFCKEYKK